MCVSVYVKTLTGFDSNYTNEESKHHTSSSIHWSALPGQQWQAGPRVRSWIRTCAEFRNTIGIDNDHKYTSGCSETFVIDLDGQL